MIVNLGVGLDHLVFVSAEGEQEEQVEASNGADGHGEVPGSERMDVDVDEDEAEPDGSHPQVGEGQDDGDDGEHGALVDKQEGEEETGGTVDDDTEAEIAEEDYGAVALLDTVIEEREERLSNSQVAQILSIIREVMGGKRGKRRPSDAQGGKS